MKFQVGDIVRGTSYYMFTNQHSTCEVIGSSRSDNLVKVKILNYDDEWLNTLGEERRRDFINQINAVYDVEACHITLLDKPHRVKCATAKQLKDFLLGD
mgnify:CR=1 FL=1